MDPEGSSDNSGNKKKKKGDQSFDHGSASLWSNKEKLRGLEITNWQGRKKPTKLRKN